MDHYDMPAIVPADPNANTTDLLVARVAETPNLALFSVPTHDGGWSDITATEFLDQVRALAKGFVAAGIGSWTSGWLRDLTGGYAIPFLVAACSAGLGAAGLLRLREHLRSI